MGSMTTAAPSPMATATGSEREVLASFLDFHRSVVVRKVADLPLDAAQRRLVPSETTLAGLLRHLAVTEREWFQHVLGGQQDSSSNPEVAPDSSWVLNQHDTVEELVAAYERECECSRASAAAHHLDDAVAHPILGRVSLRWIYIHMIEETARHAGHADILRELTDGSTGVA